MQYLHNYFVLQYHLMQHLSSYGVVPANSLLSTQCNIYTCTCNLFCSVPALLDQYVCGENLVQACMQRGVHRVRVHTHNWANYFKILQFLSEIEFTP